ncbi:MAG: hypothetical protein ABIQ81_01870 [Novosphingobium sp.]
MAGIALASGVVMAQGPRSDAGARSAPDPRSHYYGRWTVSGDKEVFSSRGKLYKTIDIAPCGRDFCGVSVAADGACGATLFRFLIRRTDDELLRGHGVWGKARKNITLEYYVNEEVPGGRVIDLNLGDGHDFGERSDNIPKFTANYRPVSAARCTTR